MESEAYHAQPDWGRSVLFALASRFNSHNNGDLSLPFSEAKRLGITSQWKLYAGLRLLEGADLIVCTRRGHLSRGTKLPSLFALTWRGIDVFESVQFDPGVATSPVPSHTWARWKRPADWPEFVRKTARLMKGRKGDDGPILARGKKNPHTTHGGAGRSRRGGARNRNTAPTMGEKELPFLAPTVVEASKTQGVGATQTEGDGPKPEAVKESDRYEATEPEAGFATERGPS
ncbi:MAG TPA: hypothetical protein PKE27_00080 [Povalibacter sp.]|uniref:hypothetical protein n=1 Tax=Povalibacter sp. TaxID=1962978 RepID=UPI002B8623EC|nr:hypothetical protein [Povalibacter sp.]HMN42943.1 hypothetical protein [Povalibacter sp.]